MTLWHYPQHTKSQRSVQWSEDPTILSMVSNRSCAILICLRNKTKLYFTQSKARRREWTNHLRGIWCVLYYCSSVNNSYCSLQCILCCNTYNLLYVIEKKPRTVKSKYTILKSRQNTTMRMCFYSSHKTHQIFCLFLFIWCCDCYWKCGESTKHGEIQQIHNKNNWLRYNIKLQCVNLGWWSVRHPQHNLRR